MKSAGNCSSKACLVLERVVPLRERHAPGVEPAVDDLGHAPHRLAAVAGLGQRDVVDVGPVQVEARVGRCRVERAESSSSSAMEPTHVACAVRRRSRSAAACPRSARARAPSRRCSRSQSPKRPCLMCSGCQRIVLVVGQRGWSRSVEVADEPGRPRVVDQRRRPRASSAGRSARTPPRAARSPRRSRSSMRSASASLTKRPAYLPMRSSNVPSGSTGLTTARP